MRSFLQDVDRIARRDYSPSDDDVVRARLRTLGVQEHRILFETGRILIVRIGVVSPSEQADFRSGGRHGVVAIRRRRLSHTGMHLLIYKYRSYAHAEPNLLQRPAWFPYFDDSDAIIFLAPISCFDEKLAEDKRVNRLEDSFQLWKMICSCKLLDSAQIILFLNKVDLRKCLL